MAVSSHQHVQLEVRLRPRRLLVVGMVLAGWLAGVPQRVFAQTDEGRVAGLVRDTTGAAVPGATIIVRNDRTSDERTTTTSTQGRFVVAGLKPSVYTVKAALAGFMPQEFAAQKVSAGQELVVDFALKPATVQETITVSGELSAIDTTSARMGANVNEREVTFLPINGRQLSQLYLQAPGALNSGTGTFGDIRFSGRAVQQNVIRYDGIEGSAIIDASPGNLNGEIPSPFRLQSSLENVQEFRVDSNSYPAEYGTGSGGQITVVTKSGSNLFHGAAFEYFRDDAFDSPNEFDPVVDGTQRKSSLRQHQFGASLGGPIVKDKAFFFGSYEGYRLDSGVNFVEAIPSDAAWARAVPAVLPLRPAFKAPEAIILPGASANPDFDIAQLQDLANVDEDAFSARLDVKLSSAHRLYVRYFRDKGFNDQPEGVTGRRAQIRSKPQNAVLALQSTFGRGMLNEFKVGYNRADTEVNGVAPTIPGVDLSAIVINLTGSVANTGIAGQGSSSGVAVPGGLLRQNSATNGRGAPYKPYSLSFVDSVSFAKSNHFFKVGGEVRLIRMKTDRLGGTTYSFSNLNDFLADRASTIQYLGDVSAPSPFNGGQTGERDARQEYFVAYAQDEWRPHRNFTLNYGVRYDYYRPLREARDLDVLFVADTGVLRPPDSPFFESKKNSFQPRVSFTWSPTDSGKTVVRGGFGILVGPGQTEDQIQPIESDRISSTLSGGAYPINTDLLVANFVNNPNNRLYQPRAYAEDYRVPEKIYQYTIGFQQELPYSLVFTAAYVGSQGRNLFLRSVTNNIVEVRTNPTPTSNAIVIREFDIVGPDGSVQRPYAEIDYKTSGGHDSYNALQVSLNRRSQNGLTLNAQYTLGKSFGNSAGSNEALTSANNARSLEQFDYDDGYNRFDVRHTFNLSAIYDLPIGKGRSVDLGGFGNALLGNWEIGLIANARSGLPIDLQIVRSDVVYMDAAGNVFSSPGVGRTALINTPGGGASRNVRRPDLVPGVDPYLKDGVQWLNPAAFTTPEPGTFGNLERGSIRGPNFKQIDFVFNKRIATGGRSRVDLRVEVFNIFNWVNYANPSGLLANALGTGTNQVQPGQPFTQAAAGSNFGRLTSTVGRTVGLGTNRQVQFAARLSF
jgi:hypothetical protein